MSRLRESAPDRWVVSFWGLCAEAVSKSKDASIVSFRCAVKSFAY